VHQIVRLEEKAAQIVAIDLLEAPGLGDGLEVAQGRRATGEGCGGAWGKPGRSRPAAGRAGTAKGSSSGVRRQRAPNHGQGDVGGEATQPLRI
jgi:hypothetical protein